MNNDKLQQLIADKNKELEYKAVRRASEIIDEIAEYQQAKNDADTKIAQLRLELKSLEIKQVDSTSILG